MQKSRFALGRPSAIVLMVLAFIVSLSRAHNVMGKPQTPESVSSSLLGKEKTFVQYSRDFLDFAQSSTGVQGDQFDIVNDLATTASRAAEEVHAVGTLLFIYESLSCSHDRSRIKPLIRGELHSYITDLRLDVRQANLGISATKQPGVAEEAIRMRDDLRRTEDALNSTKLP